MALINALSTHIIHIKLDIILYIHTDMKSNENRDRRGKPEVEVSMRRELASCCVSLPFHYRSVY